MTWLFILDIGYWLLDIGYRVLAGVCGVAVNYLLALRAEILLILLTTLYHPFCHVLRNKLQTASSKRACNNELTIVR
jgi:hypothetical protein